MCNFNVEKKVHIAIELLCVQVTIESGALMPESSMAPAPGVAPMEAPMEPSAAGPMAPVSTFEPPASGGTLSKPLRPRIHEFIDMLSYFLCLLTQGQLFPVYPSVGSSTEQ
jgi:hypothetical protein